MKSEWDRNISEFEARKALFKIGVNNHLHDKNVDFNHLARITEGLTCADIIEGVIEPSARNAANLNKELIDQNLIKPKNSPKERNR